MIIPSIWENRIDVPNHQPELLRIYCKWKTPGEPGRGSMYPMGSPTYALWLPPPDHMPRKQGETSIKAILGKIRWHFLENKQTIVQTAPNKHYICMVLVFKLQKLRQFFFSNASGVSGDTCPIIQSLESLSSMVFPWFSHGFPMVWPLDFSRDFGLLHQQQIGRHVAGREVTPRFRLRTRRWQKRTP